jgi:transposase
MRSKTVRPIPSDTASAGKSFFKKGAFYRNVGDQLGELCQDGEPNTEAHSEPNVTIPLLFLVTVFQYLENLSDSQAAAAVLSRVDWKYALHLPLISLGFDQTALDDYHRKLLTDPVVLQYLNGLLDRVRNLYEPPHSDPQKVDAASMLEAVHTLNRLSQMLRAMRLALDELAIYYPGWLKKTVLPHWFQRYSSGAGDGTTTPKTAEKRDTLGLAVGEDGFFLLDALQMEDAPPEALNLPEVEYFRHVWDRQFKRVAGKVRWRPTPSLPAD